MKTNNRLSRNIHTYKKLSHRNRLPIWMAAWAVLVCANFECIVLFIPLECAMCDHTQISTSICNGSETRAANYSHVSILHAYSYKLCIPIHTESSGPSMPMNQPTNQPTVQSFIHAEKERLVFGWHSIRWNSIESIHRYIPDIWQLCCCRAHIPLHIFNIWWYFTANYVVVMMHFDKFCHALAINTNFFFISFSIWIWFLSFVFVFVFIVVLFSDFMDRINTESLGQSWKYFTKNQHQFSRFPIYSGFCFCHHEILCVYLIFIVIYCYYVWLFIFID